MLKKQRDWIYQVFKGKFLRDDDELEKKGWYQVRKKECGKCPLNSKNIPFTKYNARMWMLYFANGFAPFCSICGCEIKAKIALEISECPDNPPRWQEED